MKQSLQLNLTQQLTLTPKLQQAIRLLQLSTIDLQQEIQQQLESNPMLETIAGEGEEETLKDDTIEFEDEFQWATLYKPSSPENQYNENAYIFNTLHCTSTSLQDYLRWQLELTSMSNIDKVIATAVIDAINPEGLLTVSRQELHQDLTSKSYPLDEKEIDAVIHRIQRFEPVGCGASTLKETLLIQLEQLPDSPHKTIAQTIIRDDLQLLARQDSQALMNKYSVSNVAFNEIVNLIQQLHPKPGMLISPEQPEYIIPDLSVSKVGNEWVVRLNQTMLPNLSINSYYASLIKRANNSKDNQFLKSNLQEAKWFLKSIQSRQDTLVRIARFIVHHQQDFLEHGHEAMKPLILSQVADALELHESTVSRATTQKFILTPHGVFELKYFFSSHLTTNNGQEYSSTAIRALIKRLISEENPKKPLSDSSLQLLIKKEGVPIARRTVAKYREEMGIVSSMQRKFMH